MPVLLHRLQNAERLESAIFNVLLSKGIFFEVVGAGTFRTTKRYKHACNAASFIVSLKDCTLISSLLDSGLAVAQSVVTEDLATLYSAMKNNNLSAGQLEEIKQKVRVAAHPLIACVFPWR
jgi:hypothetical protein